MVRFIAFAIAITGCSNADESATSTIPHKSLAQIAEACDGRTEQPSDAGWELLPVEIYNECIVEEANKATRETRASICALGRSGGPEGSTVEVYLVGDTCRTDYE